MKLIDYQGAVARGSLCSPCYDPFVHFVLGLTGEAGEVANIVLKSQRDGSPPMQVSDLLDELGDTLWYLTALAALYGYTLEEIAQLNYEKLSERWPGRYPPLLYDNSDDGLPF